MGDCRGGAGYLSLHRCSRYLGSGNTMEAQMPAHPGTQLRSLWTPEPSPCPAPSTHWSHEPSPTQGSGDLHLDGATADVSDYRDVGLITLTEMCRTIKEIMATTRNFVIVDADTGYGEIESSVAGREYEMAGAAALHVEDRVFPKRCGHLDGRPSLPRRTCAPRSACQRGSTLTS